MKDVDALGRYPYSGHSVLMGKVKNVWQETDGVLCLFGEKRGAARREYRAFVEKGIALGKRRDLTGGGLLRSAGGWEGVKALREEKVFQRNDERMLGDGDFRSVCERLRLYTHNLSTVRPSEAEYLETDSCDGVAIIELMRLLSAIVAANGVSTQGIAPGYGTATLYQERGVNIGNDQTGCRRFPSEGFPLVQPLRMPGEKRSARLGFDWVKTSVAVDDKIDLQTAFGSPIEELRFFSTVKKGLYPLGYDHGLEKRSDHGTKACFHGVEYTLAKFKLQV